MDDTGTLYFVGDLAYVLTDSEWNTVCVYDEYVPNDEGEFDPEVFLDPDKFDFDDEDAARPLFILKTNYGDGCYTGSDGNTYMCDSGTLGVIKVDYVSDKAKLAEAVERGLGHLHRWDEFLVGGAGYDGGILYFNDLDIATA